MEGAYWREWRILIDKIKYWKQVLMERLIEGRNEYIENQWKGFIGESG